MTLLDILEGAAIAAQGFDTDQIEAAMRRVDGLLITEHEREQMTTVLETLANLSVEASEG